VILAIAIAAAVLARKATSTNRDGRLRPRRRRPPFRLRIAVSRATALNYTGDAIGSICDRRCGWGARPALFAGIAGAFDRPHNNQNTLGRSIMIDSVEKTTIRKVYVRLLPLLFVAYFICYLDRINVGFAALTMNKDLGFTATVYALAATAFFWGYCLFEVPSNIILEKVGARIWIAAS
jgi:Major Facilitator Superfamily